MLASTFLWLALLLPPALASTGTAALAVAGKNCIALAVDTQTVVGGQVIDASHAGRVLKVNGRCLVASGGPVADGARLLQELRAELGLLACEGGCGGGPGAAAPLSPRGAARLLSRLQYAKRRSRDLLDAHPIVCGLRASGAPYIAAGDVLGALVETGAFAAAGPCAAAARGACESLFQPGLEPAALADLAAHALDVALTRDCTAGGDIAVHLVTPEGVRTLEYRRRTD